MARLQDFLKKSEIFLESRDFGSETEL